MLSLIGHRALVAGAGTSGMAMARALKVIGAKVLVVNDSAIPESSLKVLESLNIEFMLTADFSMHNDTFDAVYASQGWKLEHSLFVAAELQGIPVVGEVDLAWRINTSKTNPSLWFGITGTNGKTTTVELTALMLQKGGIAALACGNVGTTVIETVDSALDYDYLVLELSSFQLHWMEDAAFSAAAILNIAQDHLDWHGSFDAYADAKLSILDRATTGILNGEDPEIVHRSTHWQGQKVFFTLDTPGPGEIGIVEELLVDRAFVANPQEAAMIAELTEVQPPVPHSVSNTLAAAGLALSAGVAHESLRTAITEFSPGRHRIETIYEADGITWIDDSKATNPHAAAASIMAALSVVWVGGGLAKGAHMGDLIDRVKSRVRVALLIGEDREEIATEIRDRAPHIQIELIDAPSDYSKGGASNSLMETVVRSAQKSALAGDTVLLAPACASMDQFLSYADRGERFKAAVMKVVNNVH